MTTVPPQSNPAPNPFTAIRTDKPLVAVCGARNGYIMLAPTQEITDYASLPDAMPLAAKAWATRLEQLGSPRAYWITLSEMTPHLHIHIFPRWPQDELRGISLFESRDSAPQPEWSREIQAALADWAQTHQVEIA